MCKYFGALFCSNARLLAFFFSFFLFVRPLFVLFAFFN